MPLLFFKQQIQIADSLKLLTKAGTEISLMVNALDPKNEFPISICGRLGEALIPYLPEELKKRNQVAKGDSTLGALHMIIEKNK